MCKDKVAVSLCLSRPNFYMHYQNDHLFLLQISLYELNAIYTDNDRTDALTKLANFYILL